LHNDANILCLGGRVIGPGVANEMVDLFIDTEYEGGRHATRVQMITDIENNK
jgi:ribose 5-phosphate isomerase B